jgi:hypothetical protein
VTSWKAIWWNFDVRFCNLYIASLHTKNLKSSRWHFQLSFHFFRNLLFMLVSTFCFLSFQLKKLAENLKQTGPKVGTCSLHKFPNLVKHLPFWYLLAPTSIRLILVVGCLLFPSQPCHISFLSPSWSLTLQQQHASGYNIQPTRTSALATSAFSLPVSFTIPDLTISEFILWATNLRKQLHKKLKYDI